MAEERRQIEDDDEEEGSWLESYSDLVTDLMAVFVLLLSFSMLNQGLSTPSNPTNSTAELAEGTAVVVMEGAVGGSMQIEDELDEVYQAIKQKIDESGYSDSIILERTLEYIKLRFRDNVLFYPNQANVRESSYEILDYIGDLLHSVEENIRSIEISGHTAKINNDTNNQKLESWELSSDRAITVLKFFVRNSQLSESKMIVSGYSLNQPVASNETEEGRSQNRRVEVKINRTLE